LRPGIIDARARYRAADRQLRKHCFRGKKGNIYIYIYIYIIFKHELSIWAKDLSAPLLLLHCVPQVLIPQQSAAGLTTFALCLCLVPTMTETQTSLSSFPAYVICFFAPVFILTNLVSCLSSLPYILFISIVLSNSIFIVCFCH